jgi:hypothetical protein
MRNWDQRHAVLIASLACYAAALFLPGVAAREANPYGFTGYNGLTCLLGGPTTILGGWTFFRPWTANIPYGITLLVWIASARPRRWCAVFPAGALALGVTVWSIDTVMVNEAGHRVAAEPGVGAWLWLTSMAILLAGFLAADRVSSARSQSANGSGEEEQATAPPPRAAGRR